MANLNVFLVEDEIVVREGIRNRIDWGKTKFTLCGEAPDGEMALSLIDDLKPDIIITDIKMPFMNGLELSKIVKKNMPWVKIIILSGYDEFDFAKEAISIGITEYLVKPIDSEELLKALEKVSVQIEEEVQEKLNTEKLKEEVQSVFYIKKEKVFADLVLGLTSTTYVYEFAKDNNIDILAKYYVVTEVEATINEKDENDPEKYLQVRKYLELILENRDDVIIFSVRTNQFVLLIKGSELESLNETVYQIANSIKHKVERQVEVSLKIAIGLTVERLREVSSSFASAEKILKHMSAMGVSKIFNTSDISFESNLDLTKLSNISINDKLRHATKDDIQNIVYEYLKNISDNEPSSLLMTHYIITEILLFSSKMVSSMGGKPTEIFPEAKNPYQLVSEISTKAQLSEKISDILSRTIDFRDSCDGFKYTNIIRSAKEYIEEKYNDSNVSLKSVAAKVALSPNHFSAIFSQETGEKFIEYLTRVRVQKAKELLRDTNMRSSDIAFSVGYREPHYFSYIFKKNTGLTPRDYRASTHS